MRKKIPKTTTILRQNKTIVGIVLVAVIILLIPLVAMQITDEVKWDLADFIVVGTLLIGAGLIYELIARKLSSAWQRIILGVVVIALLLLVWIELAVGIFD